MDEIIERTANKLKVKIYETRLHMGREAAKDVSEKIRELLLKQPYVNVVFAAAPSQNEFLLSLCEQRDVDWKRINAFHMDEYVGLKAGSRQLFSEFLKKNIFDKVSFNEVHYINGTAQDVQQECRRYSDLLSSYETHIVCMGIGENGHIAFNDPHVANFKDPLMVKVVNLDNVSRQQQVNDGCFDNIDQVPLSAITLTIPALMAGEYIFCIVPGKNKREAVYNTIFKEVEESYPSTILRKHNTTLYLDKDSAPKV